MEIIKLDFLDLAWSWGIILMAVGLSRWQKLNLEGQFLIAALRAFIQLLFIGYVLDFIFAVNNPFIVIIILLIMITLAAVVARNRISKKIKGLLNTVWGALFFSSTFIVAYSIILIIQPSQWYDPQYLIPLVGMILGNTLNGASLSGERLAAMINNNSLEVETHLCLGATPQQAIASYRTEAIRIGLIPILNSMMVVGMVSLPGMFTGQVLAGNNPLDAASYQILILFMIAIANLLTTWLITEGVYRHFFNQNAQLTINN
jgi:putative ABC transport system permease protein